MAIHFFKEEIEFKVKNANQVKTWLKEVAKNEGFTIQQLNYIFCDDEYLLKVNQDYLDHDTYTDIITFDLSDEKDEVSGDIFISIDRIKANAKKFEQDFEDEFNRVLVHGLLHLIGYNDHSADEKAAMRLKEDNCLSLRSFWGLNALIFNWNARNTVLIAVPTNLTEQYTS